MLVLCAALAAAQTSPAGQGQPPQPSFAAAVDAWDRGAYVDALEDLRALLAEADEATFERIALLTGELYETTEITTDGRGPALVGRGLVMYETSRGGVSSVLIVDPDAGNRVVAEFPGRDASASPDGRRIAYRTEDNTAVWRDVDTGIDTRIAPPGLTVAGPVWSADSSEVYFVSPASDEAGTHGIHAVSLPGGAVRLLATTPVPAHSLRAVPGGGPLLYTLGGGRRSGPPAVYGFVDPRTGLTGTFDGALTPPAFSADGRVVTYTARNGGMSTLLVYPWGRPPAAVLETADPLDAPALSPDGTRVAFQRMPREDWEIFVLDLATGTLARVTREIQHDLLPRFLSNDRLLGLIGERRHRRSHVYDLATGAARRLFHNNTVRTIAPEYEWETNAAGTRVLIRADRDGDTVSPERGVYLVDLTRRITRDALDARLRAMLESERALRAFAARVTTPLAPAIRAIVERASVSRVYGYQKALFAFDSKHISEPGNLQAAEYLHATYASFGYAPEYQWFSPPGALGGRTANVIATLRGTVHPEVVYVVSSHYDSVERGPGADDDSSGTAALLETARLLAGRPQPATIVFASFTGEEAGLLGSREFVRRTAEAGWNVAGAVNNDMIGWMNDHRLDDTIRYSNPGIRDIQHAVAMTFTDLVTYDTRYYQGTDAAAFYDAWGDIVGGIGSYPVLGNPHYHQSHDVLETISHRLVTEVAKTTAATLVMLTNAPARVRGLKAVASSEGVTVTWEPSPERDVRRYIVEWTGAGGRARRAAVTSASATLPNPAPGTAITVRAVNTRGLESWDRARVQVN